jgi:hypothetical protein
MLFILRILILRALRELFPKRARSLVIAFPLSSITYKDNMTAVLVPGASAVLVGMDANGLTTNQFPAVPTWDVSDTSVFTIAVAADGLSATLTPTGVTGKALITVVAGDLTATQDVSFEAVVTPPPPPPQPGVAVSMAIQLTQL